MRYVSSVWCTIKKNRNERLALRCDKTRGRLVLYTLFEYSSNICPSALSHYKRKSGTLCNSPNLFLMTSHPCSDHKALTYNIDEKILENKNSFRKHEKIIFSPFVAKKSKKCFTLLFTFPCFSQHFLRPIITSCMHGSTRHVFYFLNNNSGAFI